MMKTVILKNKDQVMVAMMLCDCRYVSFNIGNERISVSLDEARRLADTIVWWHDAFGKEVE